MYNKLVVICTCGLMDKALPSGGKDVGSIPARCILFLEIPF